MYKTYMLVLFSRSFFYLFSCWSYSRSIFFIVIPVIVFFTRTRLFIFSHAGPIPDLFFYSYPSYCFFYSNKTFYIFYHTGPIPDLFFYSYPSYCFFFTLTRLFTFFIILAFNRYLCFYLWTAYCPLLDLCCYCFFVLELVQFQIFLRFSLQNFFALRKIS